MGKEKIERIEEARKLGRGKKYPDIREKYVSLLSEEILDTVETKGGEEEYFFINLVKNNDLKNVERLFDKVKYDIIIECFILYSHDKEGNNALDCAPTEEMKSLLESCLYSAPAEEEKLDDYDSPPTFDEKITKEELLLLNKLQKREETTAFTPFMRMVQPNKEQEMREALSALSVKNRARIISMPLSDGYTALTLAIIHGYTNLVKVLLESIKTDLEACWYLLVEMRTHAGFNALSLTRVAHEQYKKTDMTKLLRSYLPPISDEEYEKMANKIRLPYVPVMYPNTLHTEEFRKRVLEKLPSRTFVRSTQYNSYTLLMHMTEENNVQAIQESFSVLHEDEIIKFLELQNINGCTAIMIAIMNGYTEVVRVFLNAIKTNQKAIKHLLTEMYMQNEKARVAWNALSLTRAIHKEKGGEDMTELFKSYLSSLSKEAYEELAKTIPAVLTPVLHPEVVPEEELHALVWKRLLIKDDYSHTLLMRMIQQNKVQEMREALSALSVKNRARIISMPLSDGCTALILAVIHGPYESCQSALRIYKNGPRGM